jgi:hypothetical protein
MPNEVRRDFDWGSLIATRIQTQVGDALFSTQHGYFKVERWTGGSNPVAGASSFLHRGSDSGYVQDRPRC